MNRFWFFCLILFSIAFSEVQADISEIQKKIEDIEKGIEESMKSVKQLQTEEKLLLENLIEIEKQLKNTQSEYKQIEKNYIRANRRITLGEKSIETINEELQEKEKKTQELLILWYKAEDNQLFDYVLKGQDLIEILDRQKNIKRLLNYYKKAIKEVTEIRFEVELEKDMITEERRNLANLRNQLNQKRRELEKNISKRNEMHTELEKRARYYTLRIEELKIEKRQAQEEIERIIRSQIAEETDLEIQQIKERLGNFEYPSKGKIVHNYNEKKYISGENYIETTGLEILGSIGDRIVAAADGKVLYSDHFESLGYVIIIDHGFGVVSVYGNLISGYKQRGDVIQKGETIGVLGISQSSGESLLHFEVRLNTKPINPKIFFKK